MSADNVLVWEIVLKISHLPSKLRFSAKCSFFGQSLSRGHYQPTYQPPKGVYLLNISSGPGHGLITNNRNNDCNNAILLIAQTNLIILPYLFQVSHIYDLLVKFYSHEISDTTNLRSCFRTNAAYQGLKHPMKETTDYSFVPDFAHRYLTEDVPYGLVVIRGIAEIVQMDTPTIDKVLLWAQEKMGKEYLVGSKLLGKDVTSTRAPQRYGLTTLDAILGRV